MSEDYDMVDMGDIVDTPYGLMEVVDIEMQAGGIGWIETRAANGRGEDGRE